MQPKIWTSPLDYVPNNEFKATDGLANNIAPDQSAP